jgi:hypothetical protein
LFVQASQKHLDIQWHFICNLVSDKSIQVFKVNGRNNIADLFTKPLPQQLHEQYVQKLGSDWKWRHVVL